jgi:D-xylose transport system permease protein
VIVFGAMEPNTFLTANNFANLINQGAAIMALAMGLVFVLLLGEIDLSAGFTAGMGAAILGVTLTNHGWAWPLSVLAALLTGVAIGFAIAILVARLGIPSFVVSLAFFLGLQGAMLLIIGEGGTIPIRNDAILTVMNKNMPVALGWLLAITVIAGFAGLTFWAIRTRRRAGLPTPATSVWAAKVSALAVVVLVGTYLLNQERQRANAPIVIQGVPWSCRWCSRWSSGSRSCSCARASAATSTPSAATPRPPGAPASTCRTSRRCASSSARRWQSSPASCSRRVTTPSLRPPAARRRCSTPSARR